MKKILLSPFMINIFGRHFSIFHFLFSFSFFLFPFSFFLFSFSYLSAQPWTQKMQDPSVNFYDVQQSFNQYWQGKPIEKGKGWKQYKRWEWFVEPRVFPTGDRTELLKASATIKAYHDSIRILKAPLPGNWTFLGPSTVPTGGGGAGRVNCIRFDPNNSNNIFIGTPAGGLWTSTNGGTSWTTNTDQLSVLGVTDIAIDPTNTQTIYIATGDGDAGDTYSIGVLKSTDGGATWNATGLSWTVNQTRTISKLLIHPTTPTTLLAATSNGIYRTTNAGTSWTQVQSTASFKDMEFKPGDPNTVYASGTTFWKSTNGGTGFSQITSGIPSSANVDRLAITVTAADPAYVYILAGRASDSGFYGFYRSTDSGTTFTTRSTTPNLLGWSSTGSDSGGQSWYDLAVATSPTNRDVVVVGGVNVWRSTNGGTSWAINAHWTGTGAPYVHADHHALEFLPGSGTTYFSGCDGGIFKTTNSGTAWTDLSSNLQIAQMYRLGLSVTNVNLALSGWQDNGTNRFNPSWARVIGGDGMECIIDHTNASIMYGELYYGDIYKSTNGGGSFPTNIATSGGTGVNADGNWVTPFIMHPTSNQTLLVGKGGLYRTTNGGTSWSTLGTLSGGSGNVVAIAYAPSNTNYIYAAKSNAMYVSTNGGTSFTNVTAGLPTSSASITYITVSSTNPSKVWVTFSGFSSGNKVYMSTNAGSAWTNYSTGLPNLPANCIVHQSGTSAGVYVGMDVGIFYRDSVAPSWQSFNSGLPNVVIDELEIHYGSGKIRAATFGRGMWESTLFTSGNFPPVADFSGNPNSGCPGTSVQFSDLSSYAPTSWQWTFSSGTPATSSSQNPTVTYNTTGNYDVTLIACNAYGCDTITKTQYITISGVQNLPLVEGFESLPFLPANWILYNPNNDETWQRTSNTGGFGASTKCAYFNNCSVDVTGTRDAMYTPKYDFSGLTSATMTFDVAYARYDATYSDTLAVYVSTDCGNSFTQVYLKGGSTLATAPDQTASCFVPTASQWRKDTVSLNAYVGQSKVMISFENRSQYGQYLFVDNINISGTGGALPVAAFTAGSTSICAGDTVTFTDQSTGNPTSWNWTFTGGNPSSSTSQNPVVVFNTVGTYTITLTATNGNGSDGETKTNYISVNAIPTVAVTPSPATICEGSSTTITASGATSYSWSPSTGLSATTGSTVTANPTSTSTYTVSGVQNGCTGTQTVTVNVITLPVVSVNPSSGTICSGTSATLTASGASTYTWAPATGLSATTGSTVTASPSSTTPYIVTGTQNNCSDTQTVTITVTPSPAVTVTPSSPSVCNGNSTSLSASGATSYTWSPGTGLSATTGSTVTANPASTTTYLVTGTQNGCNDTQSVTVTVNTIPAITITPSNPSICTGSSTSLTASGAGSYTWSPASGLSATTGSNVTANPSATTTYTVTGTSGGCSGTQNVTVTVTISPTISVTPSTTTICEGNTTALTASGATSYSWSPSTGLSSTSGAIVDASPSTTTTYTVTGTQGGCSGTQNVTVNVNATPVITVTPASPTICAGTSTPLSASGASTYSWSPPSGLNTTTGSNVTANPTSTATYTVTGTSNGCSGTQNVTVNVTNQPVITVNPASGTVCSGDTVTLIAGGASNYSWSPGTGLSTTSGATVLAFPSSTTTYTVTGTQSGCSGTQNVTISVTPKPTILINPGSATLCTGDSTTLTATGASSYTWSPATGLSSTSDSVVIANPSSTTTYTVTGTQNGCSNSGNVTVNVNANPVVTVNASADTICEGGSVALNASGGTSYTWSPANGLSDTTGSSVTASPVNTTSYLVSGFNNGCTDTQNVTVNVTPLPIVLVNPSSPTICFGNSTVLIATGATSYSWSPSGGLSSTNNDTVTAGPLFTTTYTVTGNQDGCMNSTDVTVNVSFSPAVTATSNVNVICIGDTAMLIASGASNYSWSPGTGLNSTSGDTVYANPSSTITYTVTGSMGGCLSTDADTVILTVNNPPVVSVSPSSPSICSNESVTLTASGATNFNWSPVTGLSSTSGTTVIANPFSDITYTATETESGCNSSSSVNVTVTASPTVDISAASSNLCNGDSLLLVATGAATYSWSPATGLDNTSNDSVVATPSVNATYSVTGTTGSCSDTISFTIAVNDPPIISLTTSADTICAGDTATLSANGAISFSWSPAIGLNTTTGNSVTAFPDTSTTYYVAGISNGCESAPDSIKVNVNTTPTVTISSSATSICSGDSLTLNATGSNSFIWSPSQGLNTTSGSAVIASPATNTVYVATETESGCNGFDSIAIAVTNNANVTVNALNAAICNGDSVLLVASGASNYTWSPATDLNTDTGDSVFASPSVDITYTVIGDQTGCADSATVFISVSPSPVVTINTQDTILCDGDSVSLNASGANSYNWTPAGGLSTTSGSTIIAKPASSTTYFVTGNTNGCSSINFDSVSINITAPPAITANPPNGSICSGDSITLSVSGASGYSWSPANGLSSTSGNIVSASPATSTTYTVIETQSGCNGSATVNISVVNKPTVLTSATPSAICNGDTSILTAVGAASFAWSPSAGLSDTTGNNVSASPTVNTTYTVIGTQGICSDTATISIGVNQGPSLLLNASSDTICPGDSTLLSASGASAYSWTPATGLSSTSDSSVFANPATTFTYTVTGYENGCAGNSQSITIVVKQPLPVILSPVNASVCPGYPVSLYASGASSFSWSPATYLDTINGSNVISTPTATITYTVTENESGCSGSDTITVNVASTLSVNLQSSANSICAGDSVILTAGGASVYAWLPAPGITDSTGNNIIAVPVSATTYTVIGSSGNCSDSASITVNVNPLPGIAINTTSNKICPGNSCILSATGASGYTWSPAGELNSSTGQIVTATPTSTTVFTVTGTNNNGCSGTGTITITVNDPPVVSVNNPSASICLDDSVFISASGNATSYSWLPADGLSTPNDISTNASPDSTTIYTVTGTDDNGCTNEATVAVTLFPPMNSFTTTADVTCELKDGKAVVVVSGGASPFTYQWNDSLAQGTAIAQGLNPGIYFVTITDVNGCKKIDSATVVQSSALTVNVTSSGALCGMPDGAAQVNANGGPMPYSYLWNDSTTADSLSGLMAGTYSVTVSDASGCLKIITIEVGTKTPVISKYIIHESCEGKEDGSVAITISGGNSPYTYAWSNEASTEDISGLIMGVYQLTVTDSSGCFALDSAIVDLLARNCLNIPTGFTPNGDGKNDTWKIRGIEEFQEITVEIFNRWGTKVHSSRGYLEPWDGGGLPSAAYYYIITFGDGTNTTGTVTIVR